ncbi:MAG: TIGR00730 family Rossman fold protein [Anaerovoracaceae bacterium]
MNIVVYCGSRTGFDPAFRKAAAELGRWIGSHGHTLVYGGGGIGLMGVLADAVLEADGEIIGVIPHFLDTVEQAHPAVSRMIRVSTMSQRKAEMIELGDAFIALPGGPGTLEEISEVISLAKLKRLCAPVILADINGYYQPLASVFRNMVDQGFFLESQEEDITFARDIKSAAAVLEDAFSRRAELS